MDDRFSTILGECLEGLENGSLTTEDCLQRFPEFRSELADLLSTAHSLREGARIEPRATFRRSARARLTAKLKDYQSVTIFEPIRLLIQNRTTYFSRRFVMTWIAIAVLLASLFGGGVAVQASADALPGQVLYPLKTSIEEARLVMAGEEARIDLYLDFADRRLAEADQLLAKGAYEQIPSLFVKYWDAATSVAPKVTYKPLAANEVEAARADRLSAQMQTFTSLFETLPEDKQAAVWMLLEEGDEGEEGEPGEGEEGEPGEGEEGEPGEGEEPLPTPTCMTHMVHPVGMKLAMQYGEEYDQVMTWFCQGFGFGEIMLALQTSQKTELTAEELLLLKVELGGWGQVWKALNLIDPEEEENAEGEEQEGEEQQEGDEQEGEEQEVVKNENNRCPTGNFAAHPAGVKLAEQFGVEYDQVMTWFCNGFGFGEIMLALQASQKVEGYTPEELLAMKLENGGWGKVWQELGLIGSGKKNQNGDNGDDPGEGEENELNSSPVNRGKPADTPGGKPEDKGKPNNTPGKGQPTNKGKPSWTPGGKP